MNYVSTINDARYSRYETEADQIKSELILNPGMKLYKEYSKGYRMILNADQDVKQSARTYWDITTGNITEYFLEGKDLVINEVEL
jgi:hypothetical protein